MPVDPLALLDAALLTAHVDGAPRVVVDRLREIRQALICERCLLSPAERGRLAGMPDIAPLPLASSLVTEARDRLLELLLRRGLSDPRAVAAEIEACAALLSRAIGGPIDPNAPAGA